jgi:predicted aspartyl protease
MASEIGWVDTTGNAFVSILLAEGQTMEFLIDTGFNGELMLPFGVAQNLESADNW